MPGLKPCHVEKRSHPYPPVQMNFLRWHILDCLGNKPSHFQNRDLALNTVSEHVERTVELAQVGLLSERLREEDSLLCDVREWKLGATGRLSPRQCDQHEKCDQCGPRNES